MTITEANTINVLLEWILGPGRSPHYHLDEAEVQEAAEYLAARAYKALSAGVMPEDVAKRGVREQGRLLAARTDPPVAEQ